MVVKELDVVLLKDGRTATILEVFDSGTAYLVEVSDATGRAVDMPIIKPVDIQKIVWSS